jgi:transcriptional regulator with XRE-family HTH domain
MSKLSETDKKALILEALTDKGLRQTDAAALMNVSRSYTNQLAKKRDTGLLAPLANLARRRVKDVLSGKAIDNTEKAKTSDVLKCAELVLDRADPKVSKQEIKSFSATIEITQEDRMKYLELLEQRKSAQIISITPISAEKQKEPVLITEKA